MCVNVDVADESENAAVFGVSILWEMNFQIFHIGMYRKIYIFVKSKVYIYIFSIYIDTEILEMVPIHISH